MGNRLTKIYTRTGDDGSTGLAGGERVPKDHPRIEAMGEVDELNCTLGVLLTRDLPVPMRVALDEIQHDLFDIGGELAMPGYALLPAARVAAIEASLDEMNAQLPPLKEFVLPGGGVAGAQCHVCRAVCRRAERRLRTLVGTEPDTVTPDSLRYLNRLSDWLFVAARLLVRAEPGGEVLWRGRAKP
ncbi:MAG: cob(I)yrinic acid a,c-diamide adenosyltransferase [Thiotrichales bacterium]